MDDQMDDHMDDRDLNRLKDLAAPEPGPGAKDRALSAAMLVFEAEQKINQAATQGSGWRARLTSVFEIFSWSSIMERRVAVGAIAASLLVVPVAVHYAQNPQLWTKQFLTPKPEGKPIKEQLVTLNPADKKALQPLELASPDVKEEIARLATRPDQAVPKPGEVVQAGDDSEGVAKTFQNPTAPVVSEQSGEADLLAAVPQPAPPVAEAEAKSAQSSGVQSSRFRIKTQSDTVAGRIRGIIENGNAQQGRGGAGNYSRKLKRPESRQEFADASPVGKTVSQGIVPSSRPQPEPQILPREQNRDAFEAFENSPLKTVARDPVSTFSIDVDTASYAFVRRTLQAGRLPDPNAVRVEEMINYFSYDYPRPEIKDVPFRPSVAVYPSPWNPETKLVHIGIKGHEIVPEAKPRSNLVFLLDVSGSMSSPDKLPLLKNAFRLMVNKLGADDTVSIVTYAGNAGTVLEPTKGSQRSKILGALDRLRSGGSTAGAQGIRQAYALAESAFVKGGVNRVILATDGDFNVGITDRTQLKSYISAKRKSGVFLSVLGFGQGNYNDALMQTLAQNGNGNAAYIDTLNEARKVLVTEAGSTLYPIAKDVKIQVEFNPTLVSEYRLVGYETRALKREDFNNDKVDAGDIGSGHTVTAIYEITPVGAKNRYVDDLRYGAAKSTDAARTAEPARPAAGENATEYGFLKMRYKLPTEDKSKLLEVPITTALEHSAVGGLSPDMRFAAAVAAFGQKLRGSRYLGDYRYDDIVGLANGARGKDAFGYRAEFVNLVRLAKSLGETDGTQPQ